MEKELEQEIKIFSVIKGEVHKNGSKAICPFAPKIPVPDGSVSGYRMIEFSCNIKCPMCNIYEGAITQQDQEAGVVKPFLQLSCGTIYLQQYIDIADSTEQKPIFSLKSTD